MSDFRRMPKIAEPGLVNRVVLILLLSFLSACSTYKNSYSLGNDFKGATINLPESNHSIFSSTNIKPISPAQIIQLNQHQKQSFLDYFNAQVNAPTPAYRRVANYLSLIVDRFEYSDKTLTVEQALLAESGNCLTLANITTAYAELAGVDISYQLLEQNPVFSLEGDVLVNSDHMRSVLKSGWVDDGDEFQSLSGIRIDYFPTEGLQYRANIPNRLKQSMYYSNLAVELITQKQYDAAFTHAREALNIDAGNVSAINSLGILHRRLGDLSKAEEFYRYGIEQSKENSDDKVTFLRNLSLVLASQSRRSEALFVEAEIKKLQHNNPWQWIRSGRKAHHNGDYLAALQHYDRALEIAPGLHQVHMHAAIANYQLGYLGKSREHFDRAIKIAPNGHMKDRYQHKLAALQN